MWKCWFLHKWGKWSYTITPRTLPNGTKIGGDDAGRSKECKRCGFIKVEIL